MCEKGITVRGGINTVAGEARDLDGRKLSMIIGAGA